MAIDLKNVNISLNEFQRISSGWYNAGEVKLKNANSLAALVESFVNTLGIWRKAIASYRPVAKSVSEGSDEGPQLGAAGFVQV